jgi:hypothetical protein
MQKSKTVKSKKKILKNFNPVEYVVQEFEIEEKLALEFIGARAARNQQNDIGALEGFHKKMKGAVALSKRDSENKDVVNFYIDSGYRGFQQKYFLSHEQEEVALEANNSDSKKEQVDFYVKKAMDFARKNGLPEDKEGRASYLTQEYIGRLYDVSYDIKAKDFGVGLRRMSAMFNYTDLSKYLSNFLEDEL